VAESSVERLVLEYYDRERVPLERYLCFLGIETEAVRDLIQDAFLKLHQHLLAGGDAQHLRAWLYRVAHNLALNSRTGAHTRKTGPLPDTMDPVTSVASPEQMLLDRERDANLRDAIGALSSTQRECIVLRAQGLKYREIADVLRLSTSAVAENIQRAIGLLRKVV
jgi:RNA polymerase sigma-70 factor, ECF subfamily